ncbi:LOW QUALITY PROTEIN: hypothetical protein HID58_090114, partial [Brassica napus]
AITVNGPELGNIQVPKRASYIRIFGAQTPFFFLYFREREFVYDLFEAATGMRMMHNFFRIGGIAADLPYGWIDKCLDLRWDYWWGKSINWGLSGPMLRASGIPWDLRKRNDRIHQNYSTGSGRTSGGPYENLESKALIKKRNPEWNDFEYRFISKNLPLLLNYRNKNFTVEAPKGELGIFLIGDQSGFPWRWKIRPPGFINLQILPELVKRMKLADIMTILGSIDIIMGEVDR